MLLFINTGAFHLLTFKEGAKTVRSVSGPSGGINDWMLCSTNIC